AHPHHRDLSGPVGQDRLERLVALERPDRDPSHHAGELDPRTRGRLGDPNAARDALRPRPDLLRVAQLVALRHPAEEPPERIEESHRLAAPPPKFREAYPAGTEGLVVSTMSSDLRDLETQT